MSPSLSAADVSASGLAAERLRMEVAANNIANAHTTRTTEGGPFRRQQVSFATVVDDAIQRDDAPQLQLAGVQVVGVSADPSEFPRVYQPGHPDAGPDGFVAFPNVQVATEMVDLIAASRAYEANLNALQSFRTVTESTLTLLRSL